MLIKINKDEIDLICNVFYMVEAEEILHGYNLLSIEQEEVRNRFVDLREIARAEQE